jgi:hypothetical protein
MPKSKKKLSRTKTLIERVFHDMVKREMTAKERRVLLAKPKKTSKRNSSAEVLSSVFQYGVAGTLTLSVLI